jgi:hypothetical protein
MTQAVIDVRFLTDPDVSPGGVSLYGKFLFSYQTSLGVFSVTTPGDVVAMPGTVHARYRRGGIWHR